MIQPIIFGRRRKSQCTSKRYLRIALTMNRWCMRSVSSLERAAACRKLAKETGLSRQGLYKAIAKDGNPSFETVMKIVGAFGVRLSA
jgi:probable addiction module antidote protein